LNPTNRNLGGWIEDDLLSVEGSDKHVGSLSGRRNVPLRARLLWLRLPKRLLSFIKVPFPRTRRLFAGRAKVSFRKTPDAFLGSYCIMNLTA